MRTPETSFSGNTTRPRPTGIENDVERAKRSRGRGGAIIEGGDGSGGSRNNLKQRSATSLLFQGVGRIENKVLLELCTCKEV